MSGFITKAPLGFDGHTRTTFHFDPDSEQSFIQYEADPLPILEANHMLRTEGQRDDSVMGRKVASIDPVIYMEWCRLAGVKVSDFMTWKRQEKVAFLKRFLNSPDWYKFRTVDGKI